MLRDLPQVRAEAGGHQHLRTCPTASQDTDESWILKDKVHLGLH